MQQPPSSTSDRYNIGLNQVQKAQVGHIAGDSVSYSPSAASVLTSGSTGSSF